MSLVITQGLTEDQVLQRDTTNRAAAVVKGKASEGVSGPLLVTVYRRESPLAGWERREVGQVSGREWTARLEGLPTGGPYNIAFSVAGNPQAAATVRNVLVGDLWVLAGQSNMEGVGDLLDVEPPSPYVHVFDMADRWHVAEEPLHWLVDSPDLCHCELTGEAQQRAMAEERRSRTKGAGLGLPFAAAMVQATGVPIGLLACAHGGTSMQQWNPALKAQGGGSLYGSMLGRVQRAGGRVRGLLWYQGESDANPDDAKLFAERFRKLVTEVRADFGDPNLPYYTVQIGCFVPEGGGPQRPDGLEHDSGLAAKSGGRNSEHGGCAFD